MPQGKFYHKLRAEMIKRKLGHLQLGYGSAGGARGWIFWTEPNQPYLLGSNFKAAMDMLKSGTLDFAVPSSTTGRNPPRL